jgi:hypothetical protein
MIWKTNNFSNRKVKNVNMQIDLNALNNNLGYQRSAINYLLLDSSDSPIEQKYKNELLKALDVLEKFNNGVASKYGGGTLLIDFDSNFKRVIKAIE